MLNYDIYGNLVFEGVKLYYKNFGGIPKPGGPATTERSIGVVLEPDDAEKLKKEGWNIKYSNPDEHGKITTYLPVILRYNKFPPVVEVYTSKGKTVMTEDTVGTLSGAIINTRPDGKPWCDLIVHPYKWETAGGKGVKAYLNKGRFGIMEDHSYARDWDSYSVNEPPAELDDTPF